MPASDEYILEILLDVGLVTRDQVEAARTALPADGSIVDMLVRQHAVTPMQVTQAMATHAGMDTVSLRAHTIPQEVIEAMPRHIARRYKAIPVFKHNGSLAVAISDPTDLDIVDSLHYALKCEIEPMVAPKEEIEEALTRYYGGAEETVDKMLQEITEGDITLGAGELDRNIGTETAEDAPIIKLVHLMIANAYRARASDIHIEPLERRLRVRFRIDGELVEVDNPPKRLQPSIISRVKIMSNMSIAEKRLPQDGRIQMNVLGREIDLRVSTVPTSHGESIVMRILDKESLKLGLAELGFLSDDQATFERLIAMPDGILLVTGPTGSGKTTTLYACLNVINRPDRKIITVEDPVEYQMPGINQVAVNEDIGMTFAAALRAMLRQAPNIIMIGEIRDVETANIAINASLTGHLVFSTLHTNDAPSAITRLIDMGVKPFLVASSVRAIMAQRLIRKICPKCKEPYTPTQAEVDALRLSPDALKNSTLFHGAGCQDCNKGGYRGRAGIFEIFVIDDEVRKMITEKVSSSVIRQRARELGMRTLREDGVRKVLAGMTTPEEVLTITMGDES
ncbi:MAG: type II secretion system ATPase GspE [Verrucomicrobiae bacterium]|nr:type II secretion system ATPase GspE [Verrucomicrobiae bacterium]